MSLLAQARCDDLTNAMAPFPTPMDAIWLRPAETGLYMLRGRIGGNGPQFNMGEASVTRCSVQIGEHIGHAWVRGSDVRHAELAARADALLQDAQWHERVSHAVLTPLQRSQQERRDAESRQAAATKVEFFTVVRGE
jgi:alpha-D-ribose 1-methylphosphonate 5-triphosphate synthase subunit PhnG